MCAWQRLFLLEGNNNYEHTIVDDNYHIVSKVTIIKNTKEEV